MVLKPTLSSVFLFAILFSFSSCSIHTYSPSTHHIAESREKGNIKIAAGTGLDGLNAEAIYTINKNLSCFGGYNSLLFKGERNVSFLFSRITDYNSSRRNYFDGGFAWLFNSRDTMSLFGVAAGGGLGSFKAEEMTFSYLEKDLGVAFEINGRANYFHCFIQPYVYYKSQKPFSYSLSAKFIFLNYYNYHLYGERMLTSSSTKYHDFNYRNNSRAGFIIEPGCKLEFGKRLKFFIEFIWPIDTRAFLYKKIVSDLYGFQDLAPLTLQVGLNYNFKLRRKQP